MFHPFVINEKRPEQTFDDKVSMTGMKAGLNNELLFSHLFFFKGMGKVIELIIVQFYELVQIFSQLFGGGHGNPIVFNILAVP